MDFFEDHPIVFMVLAVLVILLIAVGIAYGGRIAKNAIFGGNRQVIDTRLNFRWAIVELGNGELIEGAISAWNDYPDSDCVQIIFEDGNVLLTHYSKVLLFSHNP